MRVKIGDEWHGVGADSAICLELTDADRRNIANMAQGATKYAAFAPDDPRDDSAKLEWMDG